MLTSSTRVCSDSTASARLRGSGALVANRQPNLEARSFSRLTHHQDLALVARDDALGGGKTKSGAAIALSGEERLEDACGSLRRHTTSSIGYPEAATIDLGTSSHFQRAAAWHRVYRVKNQIKKNFAQLA